MIITSIEQFINFPYGYGYGNSIVVLTQFIDNNIMSFLTSFEILESSRYARTPKSQLIEYILSGGIIFIILFIFYHIKYLNKYLKNTNSKMKELFSIILVFLIISILIGERIPYLLFINFLFMIALQIKQNKENNV
jgi:prolipoprotein diacylglyceryltransferase